MMSAPAAPKRAPAKPKIADPAKAAPKKPPAESTAAPPPKKPAAPPQTQPPIAAAAQQPSTTPAASATPATSPQDLRALLTQLQGLGVDGIKEALTQNPELRTLLASVVA